jgi:hypothetical protein
MRPDWVAAWHQLKYTIEDGGGRIRQGTRTHFYVVILVNLDLSTNRITCSGLRALLDNAIMALSSTTLFSMKERPFSRDFETSNATEPQVSPFVQLQYV